MVPLQMGMPGGPELLVVLLTFVLVIGVPVGVVLLILSRRDAGGADEALEARVARLEERVARLEAGDDGDETG